MTKCFRYGLQWRYEFNHTKSGVVTFGESKPLHLAAMQSRKWVLGDDNVDELYEYKNLGILKNYVGSFSSNIDDNNEKTQKKAGMIFSANLDRREINPLIYVNLWRQNWKCNVKTKVINFEDNAWAGYCVNYPGMDIAYVAYV